MANTQPAVLSGRFIGDRMPHKFKVGAAVQYEGGLNRAARGVYKVVRHLPVERDNRLLYRIKSAAESFERIADEQQLSAAL